MRIQIDTAAKIIRIENDINLNELFQVLNELFPNEKWKDFILSPLPFTTMCNLPIYVEQYCQNKSFEQYKIYESIENTEETNNNGFIYQLKTGIFNIHI